MRAHRRSGFSLIELFVVLVVIGILVGLSIPRMHQFKHQFYLTTMISDLRNLAATEEGYWSSSDAYTTDFSALRFNVTPGVWINFVQADSLGWSA
ncbi:MAG: prepilin-type N-terminal cleavage/methylation domain-containing protein, partial [Gemmatimonadaceae bacterium]